MNKKRAVKVGQVLEQFFFGLTVLVLYQTLPLRQARRTNPHRAVRDSLPQRSLLEIEEENITGDTWRSPRANLSRVDSRRPRVRQATPGQYQHSTGVNKRLTSIFLYQLL